MRRATLIRTPAIFIAALVALLVWLPAHGAEMQSTMPGMEMTPLRKPLPGTSIYNLESMWTNQAGQKVALGSFRGRPLVASMVYTHCKDVCPLTTEAMRRIERSLPAGAQSCTRFALISMDWVRDTPDQLKTFANQHALDNHWTLLHGDESTVRELAAALGVSFYRQANGDFQHSIAIFVLDGDGNIAATQTDLAQRPATLAGVVTRLAGARCRDH